MASCTVAKFDGIDAGEIGFLIVQLIDVGRVESNAQIVVEHIAIEFCIGIAVTQSHLNSVEQGRLIGSFIDDFHIGIFIEYTLARQGRRVGRITECLGREKQRGVQVGVEPVLGAPRIICLINEAVGGAYAHFKVEVVSVFGTAGASAISQLTDVLIGCDLRAIAGGGLFGYSAADQIECARIAIVTIVEEVRVVGVIVIVRGAVQSHRTAEIVL